MTDEHSHHLMKTFDVLAAAFLIVGGLNWGLIGFFGFDLIASIFGSMTLFSRILYSLVGLGGLYQLLQIKSISRRWECRWGLRAAETPTAS